MMIKRSALPAMTPIGQQRCGVRAPVWLHLSGHISSEKSLPTLGRKISRVNCVPIPLFRCELCVNGAESRQTEQSTTSLTSGQPLTLRSFPAETKGSEKELWQELIFLFFFKRASPSLFSFPYMRGAFGDLNAPPSFCVWDHFLWAVITSSSNTVHGALCRGEPAALALVEVGSEEVGEEAGMKTFHYFKILSSQRRYYTEPQLLIMTHFIFCSGCCIRL